MLKLLISLCVTSIFLIFCSSNPTAIESEPNIPVIETHTKSICELYEEYPIIKTINNNQTIYKNRTIMHNSSITIYDRNEQGCITHIEDMNDSGFINRTVDITYNEEEYSVTSITTLYFKQNTDTTIIKSTITSYYKK